MDTESSQVVALKAAVDIIGSQSALARLVGVSQQAVFKWLQKGKVLPAEHVLKVEAETGISRHALRPDLYPDESGHNVAPADDRRRPSDASVMEPLR